MVLRFTVLSFVLSILVSVGAASGQNCSTPVLVVDENGRVAAGSKDRLRSAVEAGLPLRIGFFIGADRNGKPEISHWVDAVFVTEFEGEVFTQFQEIRRQTPKPGEKHVELSSTPQRWTGSIGSDGFLEGAFNDNQKPMRLRVRATWCVDPRVPRENLPRSLVR
jgi:hypothetical protein